MTGSFVEIDWGFDNGLCHQVPDSCVPLTPPQQVRLIPYGCTNLRMTGNAPDKVLRTRAA